MFDYVDEETLSMNVEIASASTKTQPATDIYNVASADKNTSPVLYFEFIDGELRPKLNRKMGFVIWENRTHTIGVDYLEIGVISGYRSLLQPL